MYTLKKTFNLVQFFSPQKQTWTPVSGCECIGFSIQCLNTTGPWIWKASCNLWVTASHSCQALSLSPKVCCKFLQLLFVILFVILNVYISNLLFVIYGSPQATVEGSISATQTLLRVFAQQRGEAHARWWKAGQGLRWNAKTEIAILSLPLKSKIAPPPKKDIASLTPKLP